MDTLGAAQNVLIEGGAYVVKTMQSVLIKGGVLV